MSFSSGQYKNQSRTGSSFSGRDWSALEKRLNETRILLKEILANLQLVLHNLRAVNRSTRAQPGEGAAKAKSAFGQANSEKSARSSGADAFNRAKREYGQQAGQANRFKSSYTGGYARSGSFSAEPNYDSAFGRDSRTKNPYGRAESASSAGSAGSAGFGGSAGSGASAGAGAGSYKTGSSSHERAWQKSRETAGAASGNKTYGQSARDAGGKYGQGATGGTSGQQSQQTSGARDYGKTAGGKSSGSYSGAFGGKTTGQTGQAGQSGQSHRSSKFQSGSSKREYRRTYRPRLGEMTLERARAILCVTSARNVGDIKSAYRKKARQLHPDLGGDEEMMKDLNIAYDLLLQYHFDHDAPTERNQ